MGRDLKLSDILYLLVVFGITFLIVYLLKRFG